MTVGRGSYIRVFAADFNGDGQPELVAPNKGAQNADESTVPELRPVSIFSFDGDPLSPKSWRETELGMHAIPRQSYPVDLDQDGDLDIIAGSRTEDRLYVYENRSDGALRFQRWNLNTDIASEGFNLAITDINNDGRVDILTVSRRTLYWLQQPVRFDAAWLAHCIGTFEPDSLTGFVLADIDTDSDLDVFAGGYSRLRRDIDDPKATPEDRLGRLAWFENPGEPSAAWSRHDVSRRIRGMFDMFVAYDFNADGLIDFAGTRGNSNTLDGVFWLQQIRTANDTAPFRSARDHDSQEMPFPIETTCP